MYGVTGYRGGHRWSGAEGDIAGIDVLLGHSLALQFVCSFMKNCSTVPYPTDLSVAYDKSDSSPSFLHPSR